jgi:hypothetical protein
MQKFGHIYADGRSLADIIAERGIPLEDVQALLDEEQGKRGDVGIEHVARVCKRLGLRPVVLEVRDNGPDPAKPA